VGDSNITFKQAGLRHLLPSRAEALYALANMGATLGYVPLLLLLLPRRIEAIYGIGTPSLRHLGILLILGAIMASLGNIIAGHISDAVMARYGHRRPLIIAGLAALIASYGLLAGATTFAYLVLGVAGFQIGVNFMLAPLGAVMTDAIPDARKGRVAGLLDGGYPLAQMCIGAIAFMAPKDGIGGFWITMAMVGICVLPMLLMWPFQQVVVPVSPSPPAQTPLSAIAKPLILLWVSRCLMQVGATVLGNYLYLYLAALGGDGLLPRGVSPDAALGSLALWSGAGAFGGALVIGAISDVLRRRIVPMVIMALLAALSLAIVAQSRGWALFLAGNVLFHLAKAAYLSLDMALVTQLVAGLRQRARLLGFMNVANTLPSILGAGLTLLAADGLSIEGAIRTALLASVAMNLLVAAIVAIGGRMAAVSRG